MLGILEELADPRAGKYVLMSSPIPSIIIVLIYLSLIYKILPKFMENRKSYELKNTILIYNLAQIAACLYLISNILNDSNYALICQPMDYSHSLRSQKQLKICYLTYLLKISELIETIFFVLRKKQNQVSKLHVYHHSSMVLLAWTMAKYFGGGMTVFGILVNSSVHAVMYSYYLISSLGADWQKRVSKVKSSLTTLQMVQFAFLIGHGLQALNPNCGIPKMLLLVYVADVALIFKMFWEFYKKSYRNKGEELGKKTESIQKLNDRIELKRG